MTAHCRFATLRRVRAEAVGLRTALVDHVLLVRRLHGANLTYRTEEMRRAMERVLLKSARDRLRASRLS